MPSGLTQLQDNVEASGKAVHTIRPLEGPTSLITPASSRMFIQIILALIRESNRHISVRLSARQFQTEAHPLKKFVGVTDGLVALVSVTYGELNVSTIMLHPVTKYPNF
jgi:hypothetical protein